MARCLPDLVPGPFREVSATSYTLAPGDEVNGIRCNAASLTTVTIPAHADVAFPRYTRIPLRDGGAGLQVAVADAGVQTLDTPNGNSTQGKVGDARVIEQTDIDTWVVW